MTVVVAERRPLALRSKVDWSRAPCGCVCTRQGLPVAPLGHAHQAVLADRLGGAVGGCGGLEMGGSEANSREPNHRGVNSTRNTGSRPHVQNREKHARAGRAFGFLSFRFTSSFFAGGQMRNAAYLDRSPSLE